MKWFEMLELAGDIHFGDHFTTAYTSRYGLPALLLIILVWVLQAQAVKSRTAPAYRNNPQVENLLHNMREPFARQRIGLAAA